MNRRFAKQALLWATLGSSVGVCDAITRDIADLPPARLTFGQSVVNQLSFETYRDPFDELQNRPYNLLFTNVGRHANLSPWQGQAGSYTKYLNALIGNNGVANVDNDADALQGSWIRRQTDSIAWGVSAAFLAGNDGSDTTNGATTSSDTDELQGVDLRGAAAWQISERSVLGGGLRVVQSTSEISDFSFEQGVGGFVGAEQFDQLGVSVDGGMRWFTGPSSSWEAEGVLGFGTAEQFDFSEDLDDTGAITDRFVIRDYDITELTIGVAGGYNRLRAEGPGETEFRGALFRTQRELDNTNLSYTQTGGITTPSLTLLDQSPVAATGLLLSAKTIFGAGETEVFLGGQLGYRLVDGSTTVDAAGTLVSEAVDDSQLALGATVGVRQALYKDKLRFLVSGRADVLDGSTATNFNTGSQQVDATRTVTQYAIGLEGVLANVIFDVAWLAGSEDAVVPVPLGIPSGSRRAIELDRLVFSAAVSW